MKAKTLIRRLHYLALSLMACGAPLSARAAELILNGGFESGSASWTWTASNGLNPVSSYAGLAHAGSYYLWQGGAVNLTDSAYQQVSIPANASTATLTFYYNINSAEGIATAFDTFSATVRNTSGVTLATVGSWSNRNQDGGPGNPYYHQISYNLLPFAGQTIRIQFNSANDSSLVTNFRVDDVSVMVTTSCSYSMSPSSASVSAIAGNGSFNVSAGASCGWSASPNQSWIHTSSSGSGNGPVSYAYDANPSASARSGTITAGGQTFTINQSGTACSYSLSPSSTSVGAGAGEGSFGVTVQAGCSWSASPNQSWIHTSSSGSGNGTVSYTYDANAGGTRSGTITVGGQTFTVTQAGAAEPIALRVPWDKPGDAGVSQTLFWVPQTYDNHLGTGMADNNWNEARRAVDFYFGTPQSGNVCGVTAGSAEAGRGMNVRAAHAGAVSRFADGCGAEMIRITGNDMNGLAVVTDYIHLAPSATGGQTVVAGQVIGTAANLGCANWVHLMMKVYRGSVSVANLLPLDDPASVLFDGETVFRPTQTCAGFPGSPDQGYIYRDSSLPRSTSHYAISVGASPSAGGTASGGGSFPANSSVTVTAQPAACYNFVNWTENGQQVSGLTVYTFAATANRTLVANFSLRTVTITTSSAPGAGGFTSGGGTVNCGSSVTVVATPAAGYNFVNWTENGTPVSSSPNYTFPANGSRVLVANFTTIPVYAISVSASPSAGGTASGNGSFPANSSVTVTAQPAACYNFVNWTENGQPVSGLLSYTFAVTANRTLVANFTLRTVTITTSSSPGAGGNTSGGGTVNCGANVTVTANPAANYTFVNWTENGTPVSSSPSYPFPAGANRSLVANFNFVSQTGAVQVTLGPAGAVNAGAQWQVDGGPWQNSGVILGGLPVGPRAVSFKPVAGWTTPANQTLTVASGQTTSATGVYSPINSTPQQLTEPSASNGVFRFVLNGPVGATYVILASTNQGHWTAVQTNTVPASGRRALDFPIPANRPGQFYRAVRLANGLQVLQPGPAESQDIWTTSVYSYAPGGSTPGGGLNDHKLRVGGWADEYYSLLRFDLTGLPANAASAVLYLYCFNQSGGGTTMYLDRITQAWDWRTQGTGRDRERLWWADRPAIAQWSAGEIPNPTAGQWYAVDLTALYNAWQSGAHPNHGVQFRPVNYFNNNFNEFYSADFAEDPALRPKLVITTATAAGPGLVASNLNSVTSIVPHGPHVYFGDPSAADGLLKRVAKTGGAAETLATGLATFDGRGPNFTIDAGVIFGGYGGYQAYNLFSLPLSGGVATPLGSTTGGTFFGATGSRVYYGGGFNVLTSIPATGGNPSQLASGNWVRANAMDSSAIYFVEYFSRDVRKCSLATGSVTPLITGNGSEGWIFTDANNVYFNLGGNIHSVAKAGGPVSPLVSSGAALGHASDGTRVYFVEQDAIKSIPVGGGAATTLVAIPPNSLNALAVDDAFVYWSDGSGGGGAVKLWRMAKP